MAAKIKKGDKVVVLTGKDKGKTGEVIRVIPDENRAVVRGVNVARRHQRQTARDQGGIIAKEVPIHLSNIALADQGRQADPRRFQVRRRRRRKCASPRRLEK